MTRSAARGRGGVRLAAISAALASAAAHAAWAGPPADAAEPPPASTVVVTARSPAVWRLTRGASTVWVLGAVEPLPKGLAWNSAPLARLVRGADRVLLPPEGYGGVFQALRALARSRLPGGAALDPTLPPRLEADYRAALVRLGRDPDARRRDKPGWAALFLEIDFVRGRGVDISEPSRTLTRLARQDHVPVQKVAAYKAGGILDEIVGLPEAQGEAALAEASAGVVFGLDHLAAAGRAWASGDVRAMRANVGPGSTPLTVFLHTDTGRRLGARARDDTVAALRAALDRPGATVAVVRLGDLLEPGGVLDRLRGEGVAVTGPPA